jgi:hypothetical protein
VGETNAKILSVIPEGALSEVKLVNHGTVLLGAAGGGADGAVTMSDGTAIQNTNNGTFDDDTYELGCGFAPAGYSIYGAGGAAPSFVNDGTFVADVAGTATNVGVNFGNEGHVEAQAGRLELSDGGLPEHIREDGHNEQIATGSWSAPGGQIALTGGEFLFAKEVDLSAIQEAGAVVEQELWSHTPPVIEGKAEEGKALTANPKWTGTYAPSLRSPGSLTGQPATLTYQWEECDGEDEGGEGEEHEVPGTECEALEGATSPTYTLEEEEVGYTMRVVVTATNSISSETYTSEATPIIEEPAVEVPEGNEEGEEEGEPLFSQLRVRPAARLPYPPLQKNTKRYQWALELYKYFSNEAYEKLYHKTSGNNYFYAQQIEAMIGVFYAETEWTLNPETGRYECREAGCPVGIAQWLKEGPARRWPHMKDYIEEQCTRHDNCEARHHGEYSIYSQARLVWEELVGPHEGHPEWKEALYHEAQVELETEGHCERPERVHHCKAVTIRTAAQKFISHFEKSEAEVHLPEIEQFAEEVRHEVQANKNW